MGHQLPLGGLWFAIASASFLVSTVLYWLAYVGNIPVWTDDPPGTGYLGSAAWLLRIKEKAGNDTNVGGGLQYGFGVWGWCEWDSSQPKDAPDGDPVLRLDLPESVKDNMFGCAVVLFIPAFITVLLFTLHFATIRYHDPKAQDRRSLFQYSHQKDTKREDRAPRTSAVVGTRAKLALFIGWSKWFGPTMFFLALIATLPALIVTTVARNHYSDSEVYLAQFGRGFYAIIAALVLFFVGLLVIYFFGLWPKFNKYNKPTAGKE